MSASLADIADKVAAGGRLTAAEADVVIATPDLPALAALADEARRRRHGDTVTFVRVVEIGMDGHQPVPREVPLAAGELRIVGKPPSIDAARAFVRSVIGISSGTPVTGFSLHELEDVCAAERTPLEDALARLHDAGLDLVAEAQVDHLRDPARAFSAAGHAGLNVARLTISRVANVERSALVRRVAGWQATAGVVRAFAPLPRAVDGLQPSTGYDDVKQVALARLLVDNIESIQVDWPLYGPKLAQVALIFGADDVDAVSPVDTPDRGVRRAPLAEIRRNIEAASFIPLERNGRFETVG